VCAIVFITGLLRGEPALLMLLTAISLAVGGHSRGPAAVITISLALGPDGWSGSNPDPQTAAVETLAR
jgi:Ca2+-transporting ATPase